jgi:hypothetical protein
MENNVPWPNEWEQKYLFVQQQYDKARLIGIDVLKFYIQVVIALIVVPVIFHQQTSSFFGTHVPWLYWSWAFIFLAVILGILAYGLVFEGYYHQAHLEFTRNLNTEEDISKKITVFELKVKRFFDFGHYVAIGSFLSFGSGLVLFVIGVILSL